MQDAAAQAQQKQIEDAQNFEREKIQFQAELDASKERPSLRARRQHQAERYDSRHREAGRGRCDGRGQGQQARRQEDQSTSTTIKV